MVCTMGFVRRINVHLDEDLDAELAAEAARLGESKASLLRRAAREWLDQHRRSALAAGGWADFTGAVSSPVSAADHDDDVIYTS